MLRRRRQLLATLSWLAAACSPSVEAPLRYDAPALGEAFTESLPPASLVDRFVGTPLEPKRELAYLEPAHERERFIELGPVSVDRPSCPESTGTFFEDVSECVGMVASHSFGEHAYIHLVTGQAFGDFDGDGWLDIYVTNGAGPNALFRNNGDGSFSRSEDLADVELADRESGGAVFVDFDNDGDMDLYVLNVGPNVLFRNEGGWFVDVTESAGVGDPRASVSASFADYDGDGWLDIYVSNYYCPPDTCDGPRPWSDTLYHSNGDGTFEDVTTSALPRSLPWGAGFTSGWFDYDNDLDLDVYVVNDWGTDEESYDPQPDVTNRNVFWRNDGADCIAAWCFREVAVSSGVDARIDGMGLAIGDYDSDGYLDLFLSDKDFPVLYRNLGNGSFENVSESAGVHTRVFGWGTVFADFDNDADLDIFLGTSAGIGRDYSTDNLLFLNHGDGSFDASEGFGAEAAELPTYGVASGDFDRDGSVDLLLGHRGFRYGLYRNKAPNGDAHWVTIRLEGRGPINRNAVGARVTLDLSDGRRLMQEVKCGSSLGSGSDLALHFGLGDEQITGVEVRWPDGRVDQPEIPPVDRELLYIYVP